MRARLDKANRMSLDTYQTQIGTQIKAKHEELAALVGCISRVAFDLQRMASVCVQHRKIQIQIDFNGREHQSTEEMRNRIDQKMLVLDLAMQENEGTVYICSAV